MSKSKQSLERLKEQREKLNARIQAQESRLKNTERKKDTRRKILICSYFIDEAQKENKVDSLKTLMDKYLKRNSDRLLFDLELITEQE
jgi:septal ring factor EnvC (AmiA/AmiB activator)